MTDATLSAFRQIHADMLAARGESEETNNWQWIGKFMSQRHFGISEAKAKEYAARHGGTASKMAS